MLGYVRHTTRRGSPRTGRLFRHDSRQVDMKSIYAAELPSISMMDKVTGNDKNILLLGNFDINLFKQPSAWNNITFLFGHEI